MSKLDRKYKPDAEYRFFLWDPEGDKMTYYKNIVDRDEAAREAIENYLDDGTWSEETDRVVAGVVTHQATQTNIQHPVGEINEDGEDEEGTFWSSDIDYSCDYEMLPIDHEKTATNPYPEFIVDEVSGIKVKNEKYDIWEARYNASKDRI